MKRLITVGLISMSVIGLSACGETTQDAPVGQRSTGSADLINFPDGFSNVAWKCNGTTGVYVVYHGNGQYGSVSTVRQDDKCTSPNR